MAATSDPSNPYIVGNYGCELADAEEWRSARTHLTQALSLEDSIGYLWHKLGDVHVALGEIDQSEHAYRRAVACYRNQTSDAQQAPNAWEELATLYIKTGEYDKAEEAKQRARKLARDQAMGGDTRNWIASEDSGVFDLED